MFNTNAVPNYNADSSTSDAYTDGRGNTDADTNADIHRNTNASTTWSGYTNAESYRCTDTNTNAYTKSLEPKNQGDHTSGYLR